MKAGDIIQVNGIDLLVLDEIDGNPLVLAYNLNRESKFSSSTNNYANSAIRAEVEQWAKNCDIPMLERTIDLTTMDGYKGYGELKVKAALLTFDEYRKYADIIKPHIQNWFWLATGWGAPEPETWASSCVCIVYYSGTATYYIYGSSVGLVPAFILDKDAIPDGKKDDSPVDLSQFTTEQLVVELANRFSKRE